MASLELDEIDDFLSSLDPENYSLLHAFMPMDQDDEKSSSASINSALTERKVKLEQSEFEKQTDREQKQKISELDMQVEEIPTCDRSPGSSSTEENSPPSGRTIREQDRFLPLAIVSRLMKECIPPSAKVSRGARHLLQECVSEFIAFVTSEAMERCMTDRRKTLTGDDLITALCSLGFDNYVQPMSLYLEKIQAQLRGEHIDTSPSSDRPKIVKVEGNITCLPFSQTKGNAPSSSSSKKVNDDTKRW